MLSPLWNFICLITINSAVGKTVTYYIAAVEDDWSYTPSGRDLININETSTSQYAGTESVLQNRIYRKAMFREFTDGTFREQKRHSESLGIIGPVLQAEVGDRIIVHFFNNASHNHSIHPTDLTYTKSNEGSFNGDSSFADHVTPGQTYTYTWNVSNRPNTAETACVTSLYYSDVNGARDVHSGLIGIILICRPGKLNDNSTKNIPLLFGVFDEKLSLYSESDVLEEKEYGKTYFSINGYSFGNLPSPIVCVNDDVIIHAVGMGESHHVHNIKISGHSVIYKRKRHDSVTVYPGGSASASLLPTQPGKWLISTLNQEFAKRGMQALLTVSRCAESPAKITVSGKIRRYYIAVEEIRDRLTGKTSVRFFQYDNSLHSTRINDSMSVIHGSLGPVIKVEVGDTLKVVFRNKDKKAHSLFPHGVRRHKANEGIFYGDEYGAQPVPPGGFKTYFWTIPEFFAPTERDDGGCVASYYSSGFNLQENLIGPMIICKKGMLDVNDERISRHQDVFLFYTDKGVNGYSANNIPRLYMKVGDVAHVHMMTYNTKHPIATMDSNSIPFEINGSRTFSVEVCTGKIQSTNLRGNKEGVSKLQTSIDKDLIVTIQVGNKITNDAEFGTPVDQYYMGVSEGIWDSSTGNILKKRELAGHATWTKKAFFQVYKTEDFYFTDGKRSWPYGPVIRTVVGKTYTINFKNKAKRPYSMYSPGILIKRKDSENSTLSVKPEEVASFLWNIPESAGPGPSDPDCVVRMYYSNVDQEADISSGLIGPLIICRNEESKTKSKEDQILFVSVTDETKNWYFNQTVDKLISYGHLDSPDNVVKTSYELNGFRDGNTKDIQLSRYDDTTFHVLNIGQQFHSLHFHGAEITDHEYLCGHNVVPLFPWTTTSFKLMLQESGQWRYEGLASDDRQHRMYGSLTLEHKAASAIS